MKLLVCLVFISCWPEFVLGAGTLNENAATVSIISLISNPDKYDETEVRVSGVGLFGVEYSLLCLNFDSVRYNLLSNCVNVGATKEGVKIDAADFLKKFNRSYIFFLYICMNR